MDLGDTEDAAFHLQQALEKFLKAFLLSRGWELKKIHAVDTLLKNALPFKPEWERFLDLCERMEGYYFLDRYLLSLDAGTSSEAIRHDFQAAQELREVILQEFQPLTQS